MTARFLVAGAAWSLGACVPAGDGESPPSDRVYFPVSVTVSPDGGHLFIVNSDFDLQFSQGTLQSLDLDLVRAQTPVPCSTDDDCAGDQVCDTAATEENSGAPSFYCVPAADMRPCGDLGEKTGEDAALAPGRCAPLLLGEAGEDGSLLVDIAETSAFATQGVLLERPCLVDGEVTPCEPGTPPGERLGPNGEGGLPLRLFFPVRGDTTVHYVDIDEDGRFTCGRGIESDQTGQLESLRCSSRNRIDEGTTFALDDAGNLTTTEEPPDPTETEEERKEDDPTDAFRLPPEPLELAASDDGRIIVVGHQLEGYASTVVNGWVEDPQLVHILDGLPNDVTGVAAIPGSPAERPGFYLTYRTEPRVDLVRFTDDGLLAAILGEEPAEPEEAPKVFRPELINVSSADIQVNTSGLHSRGLFVDDSRRLAAVAACAGDAECEAQATALPLDVYITNRSPNSLLLGRTAGQDPEAKLSALPQIYDTIPLTAGPSRIIPGYVLNPEGERERRLFVICFDSALVYVFDPESGVIESEIRTGRGPYSMAFDPQSSLAFIAHFTDSYIGVVSLDQRHPMTYGTTLTTLADPEPPRASK